jgi:hypothetical protein
MRYRLFYSANIGGFKENFGDSSVLKVNYRRISNFQIYFLLLEGDQNLKMFPLLFLPHQLKALHLVLIIKSYSFVLFFFISTKPTLSLSIHPISSPSSSSPFPNLLAPESHSPPIPCPSCCGLHPSRTTSA